MTQRTFVKIILWVFLFTLSYSAGAQHFIDTTQNYLKAGTNIQVAPGDTIYLLAGHRPWLLLENIQGTVDSPVVICNYGGRVIINTQHYFGITTKHCSWFQLTGTGVDSINYGIDIQAVANGTGIGLSELSNHFEVDHIHIANTLLAGIYAKTDPDTTFTSVRDSFLMEDVYIHHNLLENIHDEGMYIGSTKYFGQQVNYRHGDTLLFPHLLKKVDISFNKIFHTGWDGIQLSSASMEAEVHDNLIIGDSWRDYPNQMSGIILGGGTKADCYNNYISGGHGSGIVVAGLGGQKIYNNIIINAGVNYYPGQLNLMQHGIYVDDISTLPDSAYEIYNNLIISPKSDGIRFRSLLSKNNKIANNIIIRPGNYHYYDTLHTSFTAQDAYIMLTDKNIDCDTISNIKTFNSAPLFFTDTAMGDYTLQPASPLIDRGTDLSQRNIWFDMYHHVRPYGTGYDIGPFEYNPAYTGLPAATTKKYNVFPNPVRERLFIDTGELSGKISIQIFTVNGQRLSSDSIQVSSRGRKQVCVDVRHLKPGIYLLYIQGIKIKQAQRFIKL